MSFMERLAYADLLRWKNQDQRNPILIDGARQTGKTYLVEQLFGPREFRRVHKLDFRDQPDLVKIFSEGRSPSQIVANIEADTNQPIDLDQDLIFFDEVGDCQAAVDSLKYFSEQAPHSYVCATGSNTGLLGSFPVGQVEFLELFPLCFEEFLMALGLDILLEAFRERRGGAVVHGKLWQALCEYYFVGGMPGAVVAWSNSQRGTHERIQAVTAVHTRLVEGFCHDFAKYSGNVEALHIEAVFRNVPQQLAQNVDGSVKRYRFSEVIPRKKRYQDLFGPISWLEKTRLVWKSHPIKSQPTVPMAALRKENHFKLYLFDVGLLSHLVGLSYSDHKDQKSAYKGFIAENFFLTEYRARIGYPVYSWAQERAEIEFLHRDNHGDIIPLEVKSGIRTRARSLASYIARYEPPHAIKFANVSRATRSGGISTWPLYDVQFLRDF